MDLPRCVSKPGDTLSQFVADDQLNWLERILWSVRSPGNLTLISKHDFKLKEMQLLMPDLVIDRMRMDTLPTQENLSSENLSQLAAWRASLAWHKLQRPVIIEETSFDVLDQDGGGCVCGCYFKQVVEEHDRIDGRRKFATRYHGDRAVASTAIAYTMDGIHITVATNDIMGRVMNVGEEQWTKGSYGWDAFFVPDGFDRLTLGELWERERASINFRHFPLRELCGVLSNHLDHPGVFEIHLTVGNVDTKTTEKIDHMRPTESVVELFKKTCEGLNIRSLYVTEGNRVELQTAEYRCFKTNMEAEKHMRATARHLIEAGLIVVRHRLEAIAGNRNVPKTCADAIKFPKTHYFEHHARLGAVDDIGVLMDLKLPHCTYSQVKGRWYLTMRLFSGHPDSKGSDAATTAWSEVLRKIQSKLGRPVEKLVKPEYCIYDDNLHYGW